MRKAKTILVVGRTGQLAQCLSQIGENAEVLVIAVGRPDLDMCDPHSIDKVLGETRPAIVINAAAYTAVDKAETERDEAYRVNCEGASFLAVAARKRQLPFIHLSTDYVFDGCQSEPYREDAPNNPLGAYGKSKLEGEITVSTAYPDAVIVRTSWVYSAFGTNFLKTMIRLSESHPIVRVVNDQHGSPTSAHELAPALLKIANRLVQADGQKLGGKYHLTAAGETTWHGFAAAIFDGLRARGLCAPKLVPIATKEYSTPAIRPHYSVLDCAKIERAFGIRLAPWRHSLDACLDQLVVQKEAQIC